MIIPSRWFSGLAATLLLGAHVLGADPSATTPFTPDRSAPDGGIQAAIDGRSRAGGGVVQLPAGEFALTRYLFLRNGVTLRGAEDGTTILTVANPPRQRRLLALDKAAATAAVEGDLSGLRTGMTVCIFSGGAETWSGHLGYPTIGRIEGNSLAFSETDKNTFIRSTNARPYLLYGNLTRLAAETVPGATSIRVTDPGIGAPGRALTFSGKGDQWDFHYNAITAVTGDTFYLDRPLTVTAPTGSLVKLAFALVTAEFQAGIGLENLTLRGIRAPGYRADWGGFLLAAFHSRDCTNVTLRNVTVEDWNGDGISIQGGARALVDRCTALRNGGHGFHPGTGLKGGLLTNLVSGGNAGDGVYYCWHNEQVDVVDSVLTNNGANGVGGLGIPGDMRCTVARNRIENNGKAGIEVMGGPDAHNRILGNTIRNNSRSKPGAWPGVALFAIYQEGSSGCLVASNTIENTIEPTTQWVGIEERHATPSALFSNRADKATGLMLSDRNTIHSNTLRGHTTADIVVAGPLTSVAAGQGVVKPAAPVSPENPK
jgi:hypothetical protein